MGHISTSIQSGSSTPLPGQEDRTHCPSDDEVKTAASEKSPLKESFQEHLAQCPACLREFTDHRVQLEHDRFYGKAGWLLFAVLMVIVCRELFRAYHSSH